MIVKPSCLFDESIKIDIKVMYAIDGKYSETHSRSVSYEVAQIQSANIRQELDHQYKYRFLYMGDNGDILPIYNSN
jgi:hypothetical protein